MTVKNFFSIKSKLNKSNKVLLNSIFFGSMQLIAIVYTIIRVFLMDIYLGVTNYGLLTLIIEIAPISVIFITSVQSKSLYVLYKYALTKDFKNLNIIINQQINQIKKSVFISLFFVACLMIFSYFLVKSQGMSNFVALLLVLAATIEFLSFGIIVPYVQWYLNSIYKNYIYDIFTILFSTFSNLLCFIIIGLYGMHVINFTNANFQVSSTYITLIVSFALSFRYWATNLILIFLRRRWMPWFVRNSKQKGRLFSKNSMAYFWQDFLAFIAGFMIPIALYIFSVFIPLSTSLAGIYYSYRTFVRLLMVIGLLLSSLRPYLATFFQNDNSSSKLFELNTLLYKIGFFICLIFALNLVIVVPYIMIFTKSYFSFIFVFLMIINILFYALKSIDENFIYLHGKPEKYLFLTIFEIIIGAIAMTIGFTIIFFVPSFENDVLNIIYCLIICEIILRFTKYVANIHYLIKSVYKINFWIYLKNYYKLHILLLLFIITISLFLLWSPIVRQQQELFTTGINLPMYSNKNIESLFVDNIALISWSDLICFWLFSNLFFIITISIYFYIFEKPVVLMIKTRLLAKIDTKKNT